MEKEKLTSKDPMVKVARQRMTVLQLAEVLGNVSEVCRRSGTDRTSFYEWKRGFQTHEIEGLKDLPSIHHTHPQTTPLEVKAKILEVKFKLLCKLPLGMICPTANGRVISSSILLFDNIRSNSFSDKICSGL